MKALITSAVTTVCCLGAWVVAATAAILNGPIVNPSNGHTYFLLSQNSWTASEAEARTLGGHLATVKDLAENQWILNTFERLTGANSPTFWIGLNDAAVEGQFVWVSGEPVTFMYWYPGEPNNNAGEDYVVIRSASQGSPIGSWNDLADTAGVPGYPNFGVVEVEPVPCVLAPAGLVGWWRADGSAIDSVSTNHGQLQGGAGYGVGEVGQGFALNGGTSGVKVAADGRLDVGLGDGLTIEAWIRPGDLSNRGPIIEWNTGATNQAVTWGLHLLILRPDEFGLGAGNLFADLSGVDGQSRWIMAPGGTLTTNTFQHVALTYNKASGLARLFRNGVVVAQQFMGSFTPQTSYDLYFGRRPAGDNAQSFVGLIDEIGIYNRALSPVEVQSIAGAGSSGKCPGPAVSIRFSEVEVCWKSETNRSYQVEYRSQLTTNSWAPLGLPIPGDGSINCIKDSIGEQPRRFYRVREGP